MLEWAEDEDSVDALRKRTAEHFHGSILPEKIDFYFAFFKQDTQLILISYNSRSEKKQPIFYI